MTDIGYGRLRDIGELPDVVTSVAGAAALRRIFADQELPIALLDAPDTAVPMKDIIGLYHRAALMTGTRSFALGATTDIDVGEHGLIGQFVMQAPNLRGALRRFQIALPYYESGSQLEIAASQSEVRIVYRSIYQDLIGWSHGGDFTLCIIASVIDGFLGDGWRPIRIETCYPCGPWQQDHEDLFGVPVWPEQRGVGIVIDRGYLEEHQVSSGERNDSLVSIVDIIRMGEALPREFPHFVASVIDRRLRQGRSDIDGVARILGVGPRTLQRRLSDRSVEYRELLLRCRMRRACGLLVEPEISVRQVARAVGYASTPQFTRAFTSYVGCSPQTFRDSRH